MASGCALVLPVPASAVADRAAVFSRIGGASSVAHCVRAVSASAAAIRPIVLAVAEAVLVDVEAGLAAQGLLSTVVVVAVPGAGSRDECLSAALDELAASAQAPQSVLVHDVHHSLASVDLCERVVQALRGGSDVVVPALLMVDSVKAVDSAGTVLETVDRSVLRSAQFPRGFSTEVLRAGLREVARDGFDELAYAVKVDTPIRMVPGDPDAFFVDQSGDTALADAIVSLRLVGRR